MNGRLPVTMAHSEHTTDRAPGRSWTIRLTGHSDKTATVTCSTDACRMPARSRNITELRAFAAAHATAHARAATVRSRAACHCRIQQCAGHPEQKVRCAGDVVLVMRHDPTVSRVWTIAEVCESCAPLLPHARVVARAARPAAETTRPTLPPARSTVPQGFSAPSPQGTEETLAPARPRRARAQRPDRSRGSRPR
ncbi:hypothetical protein V1460_21150 [Streptomyces sp. SCSIO 30461]|uniref:hypothetical protein n=1 Tax=Streptomyces sp. SCSIO 30461 TaxID=3118085 RepID=UPI0030D54B9E